MAKATNTQVAKATANIFANLFTEEQAPDFSNFSVLKLNEDTGELEPKQMFKYIPGMPKQYRFDAKNGGFNINGLSNLAEDTLTIQPIAFRFFNDDILGMGQKDWVELLFIDDKACVSAIMFHTHSRQQLEAQMETLFYEEKDLTEVKVKIGYDIHTAEKVQGKPKFAIATFEILPADKEETKVLKAFAASKQLWRKATYSTTAVTTLFKNYYMPSEV